METEEVAEMYEDMTEIEILLYIEKRFGCLSKSVQSTNGTVRIEAIDGELRELLNKYKNELNLPSPIPRVRSWVAEDRVNFLFFDKITGKRILLGDWLSGKEGRYEH